MAKKTGIDEAVAEWIEITDAELNQMQAQIDDLYALIQNLTNPVNGKKADALV